MLQEMKRGIRAIADKLSRYHKRTNRYQQKTFFETKEIKFYTQIKRRERSTDDEKPNVDQARMFQSNKPVNHKDKAVCLKKVGKT